MSSLIGWTAQGRSAKKMPQEIFRRTVTNEPAMLSLVHTSDGSRSGDGSGDGAETEDF